MIRALRYVVILVVAGVALVILGSIVMGTLDGTPFGDPIRLTPPGQTAGNLAVAARGTDLFGVVWTQGQWVLGQAI